MSRCCLAASVAAPHRAANRAARSRRTGFVSAWYKRHYPAGSVGRNKDPHLERTAGQFPSPARSLRPPAALLARHLRPQPGRAGAGDRRVGAPRELPRDRALAARAQHGARAGRRVPPRAAGPQHAAGRGRFRARSARGRHAGAGDALAAQGAGTEHARPRSVGGDGAGQVRQPAPGEPRLAGDAARAGRAGIPRAADQQLPHVLRRARPARAPGRLGGRRLPPADHAAAGGAAERRRRCREAARPAAGLSRDPGAVGAPRRVSAGRQSCQGRFMGAGRCGTVKTGCR